jgi:uncharacterized protein (UPF0264 family)
MVELARPRRIETSAALGDLPFKPGTAALAACGAAMTGVDYVKAGLHGVKSCEEARALMDAVREAARMASERCRIVASGYADYRRFGGLSPLALARAARQARCDVVLLDTAVKDGTTLFDALPLGEIQAFVEASRDAGLQVALAGSLGVEHADLLFRLGPDIVGVRGAVCEGENRNARVSPEKARRLLAVWR